MALPNTSAHCKTTAVRNYAPFTIGDRRIVSWDRDNPVAKRFGYMGEGVRDFRRSDTINDVAGVTVSHLERTADPERPAAGGLGPGVLAMHGFAWVRLIGPALARSPFFVTSMRGAIAAGIEPFCGRLVVNDLPDHATDDGFAFRLTW